MLSTVSHYLPKTQWWSYQPPIYHSRCREINHWQNDAAKLGASRKETLHGLSPPIFWSEVKSLSHVWLSVTPWTVCSPTGSSVHGIFQARVLEWVAISFSRGSSQPRDRTGVSCIVGRCFTKPQGSLTPCYNLQLLNPNGSQKGSWLMPTLRDNYQGYTTGLLLLSRFSHVRLYAPP